MHGRTIKILLDQGTPSGIRHAEVVNWTGQAVVCPRARVSELSGWADETERPGVYLLLGKDDQTGRDLVYVGEAENVRARLQDHVKNKEFWREAILFTSKDFNLTKSHVKYLESRLVQQVGEVSGQSCSTYIANLRFAESYAFTSPSTAAGIVAGGSRNGREGWKLEDGRSLEQVEEEEEEAERA